MAGKGSAFELEMFLRAVGVGFCRVEHLKYHKFVVIFPSQDLIASHSIAINIYGMTSYEILT